MTEQLIQLTETQLQNLIAKQVQAAVGSMSVKGQKRELPKIDLSTKEKLEAAFLAAGHQCTSNFLAEYTPPSPSKRDETKTVGGYAFLSSTEKVPFNGKAKLWVKVAGLAGLTDLDGIQKTVGKLESEIEMLQGALDIARDAKAGFAAIYGNMVSGEARD